MSKELQMFQMFHDRNGLVNNEFTVKFQKSKSLGLDLAFKRRLKLSKNR